MKGLKIISKQQGPNSTPPEAQKPMMNMEWIENINNVGCNMSETYLCFILKVIKIQTDISIYYYHNDKLVESFFQSSQVL